MAYVFGGFRVSLESMVYELSKRQNIDSKGATLNAWASVWAGRPHDSRLVAGATNQFRLPQMTQINAEIKKVILVKSLESTIYVFR
jgi:hypothetical protein